MIKSEDLQRPHLDELITQYPRLNPRLIEKMIRALRVLELMSQGGKPFIFKGGTALMLLLGEAKRLSIDLDIVLDEPKTDVRDWLSSFLPENYKAVTTHISLAGVPKNHYRVFYHTALDGEPQEDSIKIDVLFGKSPYAAVVQTPIELPIVGQEGMALTVSTPDLHSILGDKLTAFAPNTVGVPYRRVYDEASQLEVIKQMHDVAALVRKLGPTINLPAVKATYQAFVAQEAAFRGISCTWQECLNDAYQTVLCLLSGGAAGAGRKDFEQIKTGLQAMSDYVLDKGGYLKLNQMTDATYVCWLATALLQDDLQKVVLPGSIPWDKQRMPHRSMNGLKNAAPELLDWWAAVMAMRAS